MAARAAIHSVADMLKASDRSDEMGHRTGRKDKADRVRVARPPAWRRAMIASGTRTRS